MVLAQCPCPDITFPKLHFFRYLQNIRGGIAWTILCYVGAWIILCYVGTLRLCIARHKHISFESVRIIQIIKGANVFLKRGPSVSLVAAAMAFRGPNWAPIRLQHQYVLSPHTYHG